MDNKRRFERIEISDASPAVQIQVQGTLGGVVDSRTVKARDISRRGMSFTSTRSLSLGTRCVVLIPKDQLMIRIIGKVTNCREISPIEFAIGLRFINLARLPDGIARQPMIEHPVLDQLGIDL